MQPVARRIPALDALRGLALVGIILGNVTWFSGYAVATPQARAALGTSPLDSLIGVALHVAVDGKFYGLFSLIFGAGFALMLAGAEARGHRIAPLVRRRLAALFVLGLAHASLVWFGDIMSLYAVAAIPLYWMRNASPRRLAAGALICLTMPVVCSAAQLVVQTLVAPTPPPAAGHGPAALLPAFASGTYADLFVANRAFLVERWALALHSSRLVRLLGLFLLGMLAVRMRPEPSRGARRGLLVVAVVSNVALALFASVPVRPPTPMGLVRDLVYAIAIPTGSLAYAAVLWPWLGRRGRATRALAAAGRLSLTHYVTQSMVMAGLFYGCGWGLWGRLGLTGAVAVALAIVATQILLSVTWVARYGHGPGEWLLRRMSRPSA